MANGSIGKATARPPGSVRVWLGQVHRHLGAPARRAERYQLSGCRAVDHDGQQPVLERVVAEDVGKVGADHRLEAERRSAQGACSREEPQPKLSPGDQDAGALRLGPVEHEVGPGRAVAS